MRDTARPARHFRELPFVLLMVALSALHLATFAEVPFHPDEATYLYMSGDADFLVRNPLALAWDPEVVDTRQNYRLINAPLTRYWLGVGRSLIARPALPVDWDWGSSWAANRDSGALPPAEVLWAGRLAMTLLLPLSLAFLYAAGRRLGGRATGWVAALLLGTHALVLLHARRAMTEGPMTLGLAFALWALPIAYRRPWLSGLAVAVAINAKQFAVALVPVALVALAWLPPRTPNQSRRAFVNLLVYVAIVGSVTVALNPVVWRYPQQAVRAMWLARADLLARQVGDVMRVAPAQALHTPGRRAVALFAHLYVLPPSFAEVGNYLADTASAEAAYMNSSLHHLMRGGVGGGLMMIVTLFGFVVALVDTRRAKPVRKRALSLTLLATTALLVLMLTVTPLPWQRYSMPMLPVATLWAAYGVGKIVDAVRGDSIAGLRPLSDKAQ